MFPITSILNSEYFMASNDVQFHLIFVKTHKQDRLTFDRFITYGNGSRVRWVTFDSERHLHLYQLSVDIPVKSGLVSPGNQLAGG